MSEPLIRDARLEEMDEVRRMLREYQAWLGIDLCFQGFEEELGGLPGDYAAPRGRLLVAEDGSGLAGCVALRRITAHDAEMKRLFVRPAWRGQGLGRRLALRAIAEARHLGHARLVLDTLPVMKAAQEMYRSLGFLDIAPYRENPVAGARYLALALTGSARSR
ncbi:MAG: GNAT family N-acetyltransferase [Bryobacteraceae bacterium]|nr:GNAT family N-acetyltransferase [Bryobacteraceae bacterium]